MSSRVVIGVLLSLFMGTPSAWGQAASRSWEARFREEAPAAWESYRARAKQLEGSVRFTIEQTAPERRVMTDQSFEIKQGENRSSILTQNHLENSRGSAAGWVEAVNERYAFKLKREGPDATWLLAEFDDYPSDGLSLDPSPWERIERWVLAPVSFMTMFGEIGIVATEPGFSIRSVTGEIRDGAELAKVAFVYKAPTDRPRIPTIEGWVQYDPARMWVIRGYDVRLDWANGANVTHVIATYEYRKDQADGVPLLRHVAQRNLQPKRPFEGDFRFEFDLAPGDPPAREFLLTAYGLPEPAGSRWRVPWYLILSIAGIVLLAVSVAIRRKLATGSIP